MNYYPYSASQTSSVEGTYLPGQPNYPHLGERITSSLALNSEQASSNFRRQHKLCKANLIRQIIRYSYRLLVDHNGVFFLMPYGTGPVLILEAEMVSPIIKQMVANIDNRDVSEQSVRDAMEIIRRDQADNGGFGNGRTWLGESNERYIVLDGGVTMFPSGQENLIQPQQYYPYWQPTNCRPYRTLPIQGANVAPAGVRVIESHMALPKDRELLIYTYMVLCLMPERQQLALELTGESKSGMARLLRTIKSLVDPVIKEIAIRDIPSTVKEVNQLAWRHQVINLENVEVALSPVVQRRLYEFLCNSQLEWKAVGCHETTSSLAVSRACVLSSLEPVITHDELAELTLSLEMLSPPRNQTIKAYPYRETYHQLNAQVSLPEYVQIRAFNALLGLLGKAHAKIETMKLDREVPDRWDDFCRIGMILSETLTGSIDVFWSQFEAYRNERLSEITEEEPVAQAIIEYLRINAITEAVEKPAGVWLATLAEYRPICASESQWPREPRGLGAAFKRAAPLLDAQGITCYSNGKRGSKRHWVIGPKEPPRSIFVSDRQTSCVDDQTIDFDVWNLL